MIRRFISQLRWLVSRIVAISLARAELVHPLLEARHVAVWHWFTRAKHCIMEVLFGNWQVDFFAANLLDFSRRATGYFPSHRHHGSITAKAERLTNVMIFEHLHQVNEIMIFTGTHLWCQNQWIPPICQIFGWCPDSLTNELLWGIDPTERNVSLLRRNEKLWRMCKMQTLN